MTLKKIKKMSTKSQISTELSDSISNVLGKNVKILYKSLIRMESRGDKVDNKVLVDNGFHLMEIEAIESKKANHLSITLIHEHKPVSILIAAFDDLYPNVAIEDIICKVNLPFQLQQVSGTRKHSTCGDFSNQYAAMCDLCQTPFRAEVAWDIDTIYLAHDIRMLHLKDFDHLDQSFIYVRAISILSGLANNPDGLRHIALSQCGLTGKTVSHLATMLNDNPCHLSTLSHLDLSHNNLKDDVHNLYNFLAQPNVLTHLNLTNTETTLENMWGALLRGCAARLAELLVGRNPWSSARRPKDPPPSFRQFFTACLALSTLDFSYCKMLPDALKYVRMELELSGIVRAIGKNHSIHQLSLSRLTGKRSYAPPLIQALVHVLQEPDTALTSLDLSDCKLKGDLYGLLNALGGARRLRSLDVGGNLAGDAGARLLAKALQCNCTLHTLVRRVEFPGCDAAAGGRGASERVAALWRELHERLAVNSAPATTHTLRAMALERAWGGGEAGAALAAQAAAALPPPPLPAALERAAAAAHHLLHQYLQRCSEVFAAMGGGGAGELVPLQAVRDAMAPCASTLQDLLNEAVENLALSACEGVDSGDSDPVPSSDADIPDLLTPISHSARGGTRRVRPKSVAEQQCSSNEMLSLPPLHGEAGDALADLPAHTLRHLVKGRPRRVKTRAPSRPITDQSQDIDEGLDEFWRTCRTPPGSEEASLSARTPLTSRSLVRCRLSLRLSPLRRSPTLLRDDTMYVLDRDWLTDIATALRRSVSVRRVEFPGCDAAAGGRGASERVAALWRELHERLAVNSAPATTHTLRAMALERAWGGGEAGAALAAQAAAALPPPPLPAALERAAAAAHHLLHQYLQRCSEVFAAMGGGGAGELVPLQAVRDAMAPCASTLQDLLNEAVENLALSACEGVDSGDSDPVPSSDADIPDLLTPISHSARGTRRVRPKSVAEQQCSSNEMLSLPPLHGEAGDALADLPAHTLRHLVKGRPRRVKTRAPSRPITDQSQDIDEGLDEFWRTCRTPPGSEEASLSARTPLTSRSLHSLSSLASPSPLRRSPTLLRDDTMYSVTSGESTPVLLECEVSRCKSSDNVGTKTASTTPPPSRSSDNVNTMGNGCARTPGKARPWSVAGVNPDNAACTTGSMLRDHPITPEGAEA
ncbi:hypothetical protein MSG28_005332 [Choristoneura fumiferana]|uniref:Uncharacterized protein n=1 Tax=Choristoneura fumiferana TaxID=7141 RepID=A0ACC0JR90_CHOFU|nr:hypothetical protein MSG28_005332 [Choristoneura fumiferana]